jgi:hypothetical protein
MGVKTNHNETLLKNKWKATDGSFRNTKTYAHNAVGVLGSTWTHSCISPLIDLYMISHKDIMLYHHLFLDKHRYIFDRIMSTYNLWYRYERYKKNQLSTKMQYELIQSVLCSFIYKPTFSLNTLQTKSCLDYLKWALRFLFLQRH